jgi:hypothetical protein
MRQQQHVNKQGRQGACDACSLLSRPAPPGGVMVVVVPKHNCASTAHCDRAVTLATSLVLSLHYQATRGGVVAFGGVREGATRCGGHGGATLAQGCGFGCGCDCGCGGACGGTRGQSCCSCSCCVAGACALCCCCGSCVRGGAWLFGGHACLSCCREEGSDLTSPCDPLLPPSGPNPFLLLLFCVFCAVPDGCAAAQEPKGQCCECQILLAGLAGEAQAKQRVADHNNNVWSLPALLPQSDYS